jgi:hypothetical protein
MFKYVLVRKSLPKCGWPFPSPVRPAHFQKKRALRATHLRNPPFSKNRALRATHPRDVPIFKNSRAAHDPPANHDAQNQKKTRAARDPPMQPTIFKKIARCARPTRATHPRDVPIFNKSRAAHDPAADHHAQTKKIAGCERPTRVPPCSNQKNRALRAAHLQTTMRNTHTSKNKIIKIVRCARDPPANRHVQNKQNRALRATYPQTTMFKPTKIASCARPTMRAMSATMVTIHES